MKIKAQRSGASEFLSVYNTAIADYTTIRKSDLSRLYNLRCSQLPYCPSSVLIKYAERGTVDSMDMLMAYYVSVGTAVHTVMQTYLPQSGAFLANYTCKECGTKYPMSHKHECCGFPTEYDEPDLDYKGVQGHIDGVFRDSNGEYWIIDFKTTSLKASESKPSSPGIGYTRQVRAYAYLLWVLYKIRVAGVLLVFIPRDDPKAPVIWEERVGGNMDQYREELLNDKLLHIATMKAKTLAEMKPLLKHVCGNSFCKQCSQPVERKLQKLKKHLSKFPIKR